jgi:hypothetical protein
VNLTKGTSKLKINNMFIQIGDRYNPLPTEVNKKLKISKESLTTVCFVDQFNVSVYIDKVPGFNGIEARMSLSMFAANFSKANEVTNKAYAITKHFSKEYPLYFAKILGV